MALALRGVLGLLLNLNRAQALKDLVLRLVPADVVAGRIVDPDGAYTDPDFVKAF